LLLDEHAGEVWLIPHTFAETGGVESDPAASHQLRDSLPATLRSRVRIVTREYNQHEMKGVIGQCDFFIGSRMHACIAALSQGVPCVGVAYSMKFAGVFESVGAGGWVVDGREVGNEEAVARILELYRQRDALRGPLGQAAKDARAQLQVVFRRLLRPATSGLGEDELRNAVQTGATRFAGE
jgi:polysaccharide pyruvyl transferase WcaK-like protein